MKKLCLCLLLCLCLCLGVSVCASAEETLDYVTDAAGILTQEQAASLNAAASQIAEQYSCAVYLVTLPDYRSYNSEGIEQCTQELYHYFDLGYGENRDGLILLLSMAERDYNLWADGTFGMYAFTEYGLDCLEERFLPYFRENNWYGGFTAYLNGAAALLDQAARGEPAAYRMSAGTKAAVALTPAGLIGFLVCSIFKGQMKTAKEKETAEDYVVSGSARLRVREDQFINRTRTVHVIESSSGGGGSRPSGGGTSHHSGKF